MDNYYSKSKEEIFQELNTSESGLTEEEAQKRFYEYGRNIIQKTEKFKLLKILFQQFNSFLIYILLTGALISFLINHILDGVVISIIVILNALIGFFQQYKAEKAVEDLKKLIIPKSKVIRNKKTIIVSSTNLVPGDIVLLESGDKISADLRIIESENLQINESILTGESFPVNKSSKILDKDTILSERENMLFTGTQVINGSVKAIVVSIGMNTVFGKIAEELQTIEVQKTPMQKSMDKFAKQIGTITLIFVTILILLGISKNFDLSQMLITAVVLAVASIPEGLPAVITISFAVSSVMMSKKNVVVRKLSAVESLGSVTVICTDKTGTLTEEKMHVQKIFSNNKFYTKNENEIFIGDKKINIFKEKELFQLFKSSILCNNARFEFLEDEYQITGDPTEQALLSSSLDLGLNKKLMIEDEPSIIKLEFDSKRKMMSVLRDNGRNNVLYTKGAPEKIISISSFELINGQIKKLSEKRKKEILSNLKEMEESAFRVLGFGFKNFNKKEKPEEKSLIFLGFIGMIDPPRKEVKDAIKQCIDAGIKVKIITGDSVLTAIAIAKQIGISGKTLTEQDLEKMSDEDLSKIIDEIAIFARITPNEKFRITKILQQRGEIVAITGDGINDVLALKSADVGIAMGIRGTDVARDVSEIVLIDDNFASIVEGIKQGRKTYDNIKKFTKYFLAVNFSEIFLVLFALILGTIYSYDKWFLPLLPLQILWINLVTDIFPAISLIFEKEDDVMNSKPRNEKSILEGIGTFVVIAGVLGFIIQLAIYLLGVNNEFSVEKTRTFILTTVILFELTFIYACRSDKSLFKIGFFSNKWMNYGVFFSFLLHLVLLYTPLGIIFGVVPMSFNEWLFILPFSLSGIFLFEGWKLLRRDKDIDSFH